MAKQREHQNGKRFMPSFISTENSVWTDIRPDRYADRTRAPAFRQRGSTMTKLADAIRRSQRIESAPMGFGAARAAAKPTMVVGAVAKSNDSLQSYNDAGINV